MEREWKDKVSCELEVFGNSSMANKNDINLKRDDDFYNRLESADLSVFVEIIVFRKDQN